MWKTRKESKVTSSGKSVSYEVVQEKGLVRLQKGVNKTSKGRLLQAN